MESCHSIFVIGSCIRKLQKKLSGELNEYTWRVVIQIL